MRAKLLSATLLLVLATYNTPTQAFIVINGDGVGCPGTWDDTQKQCLLTANIADSIVLNDSITLDCDGFSISNPGSLIFGIFTDYAATIKNCVVENFQYQIFAGGAEVGDDEKIEITGSRILRTDLSAPTEIHIYSDADININDCSIEDLVDELPVNVPLASTSTGVQTNSADVNIDGLNLRGAGAGRTLVLVSGRRVEPGGRTRVSNVTSESRVIGAFYDADFGPFEIPSSLVEKYEILNSSFDATPGYGGDAIAGLVTFVPKEFVEDDDKEIVVNFDSVFVSGFDTGVLFENGENIWLTNVRSTGGSTCAQFGGSFDFVNIGDFYCDSTMRVGKWTLEDSFTDFWVVDSRFHYKNKNPEDEFDYPAITVQFPEGDGIVEDVHFAGIIFKDYSLIKRLGGDTSNVYSYWNTYQSNCSWDESFRTDGCGRATIPNFFIEYYAENMPFSEGLPLSLEGEDYCLPNERKYPNGLIAGLAFPTFSDQGEEVLDECDFFIGARLPLPENRFSDFSLPWFPIPPADPQPSWTGPSWLADRFQEAIEREFGKGGSN